jgi:hypothetical protein
MFWRTEVIKRYNDNSYKATTKFAWLPKILDDGYSVFFENYISIQKLIYPKQDLPLHIETPDHPFWIECESRNLSDVPVNTESILEYELEDYLKSLEK